MSRTGRPKIDIDWDTFEKLCAMQCTQEEIASVFDCHIDTLTNRCKDHYGMTFSEVFAEKRQRGKSSLRRAQWNKAVKDKNTVMQIFLGKQYLGQKDRAEQEFRDVTPLVIAPDDSPA